MPFSGLRSTRAMTFPSAAAATGAPITPHSPTPTNRAASRSTASAVSPAGSTSIRRLANVLNSPPRQVSPELSRADSTTPEAQVPTISCSPGTFSSRSTGRLPPTGRNGPDAMPPMPTTPSTRTSTGRIPPRTSGSADRRHSLSTSCRAWMPRPSFPTTTTPSRTTSISVLCTSTAHPRTVWSMKSVRSTRKWCRRPRSISTALSAVTTSASSPVSKPKRP